MSAPDDPTVNYTVKELIASMRTELVAGLNRIETKLDGKASAADVADLQRRVDELEDRQTASGAVGNYRARIKTGLLTLCAALIGGITAHVKP